MYILKNIIPHSASVKIAYEFSSFFSSWKTQSALTVIQIFDSRERYWPILFLSVRSYKD